MNPDSTNPPQPQDPYTPASQPVQPTPGMGVPPPQPQQPSAAAADQSFAAPNPPQPGSQTTQPAPQPGQSQRPPLRIDHNLLAELGLAALPDEEKKALEKHIYETLEMRVGMRLADQMTNEQLDEFETYFNARDDAGAFRWLETNFPNYKDIVADEFEKLKSEVGGQASAILAASQQQATAQPTDQQPTPMPPAPQPGQQAATTEWGNQSPSGQPPQAPQWPTPPAPPTADQQPPQSSLQQ